jgi:thiamine-phosphate pyrophosphorylase
MVVTDRGMAGDLVEVVSAAVEAGARLVLLREKDLPRAQRRELALRLPGRLILATDEPERDASLAEGIGAVGLHLSGASRSRRVAGNGLAWGRSCHSAADVEQAEAEGAAWVTLSPIFATTSKPGYGPALGTEALRAIPNLPTYALGGVTPRNAKACVEAGAAGVAVMGAVMRAADPGAVVRRLLAEVGETVRA